MKLEVQVEVVLGTKTRELRIPIDDYDFMEAIRVTSIDRYESPNLTMLQAFAIRTRVARTIGFAIEEAVQQLVRENQ